MSDLKALCDEAVSNPAFAPRDGKTYCNFAARFISEGPGFFGLPVNTLANGMIAILELAPEWREDSLDLAHSHAVRGRLAFVALSDEPHGHIAAVYPAPMAESGSWGQKVPMIANVGKVNGIMRLSGAFRAADKSRMRYFLYG